MVRVCIVGCLHGELDKVYSDIEKIDRDESEKTQLVLCCGDFQSLRNPADLNSMSVPPKFYRMGDFYRYYSEEVSAPLLTIFVGGNHEASGFLQELPYGGWVAPNIWFMGYAGVVQFAGLRIAGLSGIYKQHDYAMGHFEHPPFSEATKRSVYHLRSLEVFRLGQLERRVDIVISHDWPRGIYHYGDTKELLQKKKHFHDEVHTNTLGSPPSEQLLCRLRPRYWFSAHLHCKFSAVVAHPDVQREFTKFLALDKCLPSRDYLQFLNIEPDPVFATFSPDGLLSCKDSETPLIVSSPPLEEPSSADGGEDDQEEGATDDPKSDPPSLFLDPEWMCILKSTNDLMSLSQIPCMLPGQDGKPARSFQATSEDLESLWEPFAGTFAIPDNFERTAPVYKPDYESKLVATNKTEGNLAQLAKDTVSRQPLFSNPQTELLCAMLDLINPNALFLGKESYNLSDLASRLYGADDNEELPESVNEEGDLASEDDEPDRVDSLEPKEADFETSTFIITPDVSLMTEHDQEEYDPSDPSPSKKIRYMIGSPKSNENSPAASSNQVYENPEVINLDALLEDDEDVDDDEEEEDSDLQVEDESFFDDVPVKFSDADESIFSYHPRPLSPNAESCCLNSESENAYQP